MAGEGAEAAGEEGDGDRFFVAVVFDTVDEQLSLVVAPDRMLCVTAVPSTRRLSK